MQYKLGLPWENGVPYITTTTHIYFSLFTPRRFMYGLSLFTGRKEGVGLKPLGASVDYALSYGYRARTLPEATAPLGTRFRFTFLSSGGERSRKWRNSNFLSSRFLPFYFIWLLLHTLPLLCLRLCPCAHAPATIQSVLNACDLFKDRR